MAMDATNPTRQTHGLRTPARSFFSPARMRSMSLQRLTVMVLKAATTT